MYIMCISIFKWQLNNCYGTRPRSRALAKANIRPSAASFPLDPAVKQPLWRRGRGGVYSGKQLATISESGELIRTTVRNASLTLANKLQMFIAPKNFSSIFFTHLISIYCTTHSLI